MSPHLIAIRAFSRLNWCIYRSGTLGSLGRFAELGHTSAQLALLVDRVRSPLMRRIAGLPVFQTFSESRLMPTIALVDDDRNILTSVSIALEAEGYRIMTYTDGASALDGFRTS